MAGTPDNRAPGQAGSIGHFYDADTVSRLGHFEAGIEGGMHIAVFEGDGLIVDMTGKDGSGTLKRAFGSGMLGIEDLLPVETQLRQDSHTGKAIHPTHQARVILRAEVILTPLDYEEAQRRDSEEWHLWVLNQDKLRQERGDY